MDGILQKTAIKLVKTSGETYLEYGVMLQGYGLIAIYANEKFDFVCTTKEEFDGLLVEQGLILQKLIGHRQCDVCGEVMSEGFYMEYSCNYYCSETCLSTVMTWDEYLELHDDGNGEAYWTVWED